VTKPLHIPPFVNYDCRLCGWCCRQYDISFSKEDLERLSQYDWGRLEPALAGREWCAPLRDASGYAAYRLRYSPEGACVFLSGDNKCLMHKHVGEMGKAIGCSVYPFSFVATPTGVYVGCRFSCEAVAYGLGEPVVRRADSLKKQLALCEAIGHVPRYGDEVIFDGGRTLPWADYLQLEKTLTRVLLRDDLPLVRRLLLVGKFIEVLRDARLERVRGPKFGEFIRILEAGLFSEAQSESLPGPPGRLWRMMFRQFCSQFQQRQGGAYQELGTAGKLAERLRQFWTGVQFTFGRGSARLPGFPDRVALADVQRVRPGPPDQAADLALSRFLAAKLFGKQYFGKFFFDYSLLDGLNFLLLAAGAVMWYARAGALARGAETTQPEDVIEAIRYVDFCYGYSRSPALLQQRVGVRLLSRGDTATRLALSQFA